MARKYLVLLFVLGACAAPQRPAAVAPPPAQALVPLPPVPPRGQPNRFSNITAAQLRTLLGTPAFVRKDGQTEMWRYDAPSCHAFFFISGGAQQRVGYIQTSPTGKDAAADPACLNALQKSS